ncbi:MAG: phosphoribosylformimino-5-aminoimidazole carboxamide ribotide isomerase [Cellvibrionales bacterium]|nr:phosphoribosylformimino-5-aminoimidazole carboxamide ribotide isomerase [Cellvibrionales bacterium]
MTKFRPCIDIHQGQVKQIVGGSLNESGADTNFVSQHNAAWYADLYKKHQLKGGHVISLGQGNQEQVKLALAAYPGHLQYGGGVTLDNALDYLKLGASHVIVTSFIFDKDILSLDKVKQLSQLVGKERLVLDLSCRKKGEDWFIATNRWQTVTQTAINEKNLETLSLYCDEFLIHAADVEGLQGGIDTELVKKLSQITATPCTYAGGAKSLNDLKLVDSLSNSTIDLTIGSALDIFGGKGITLEECLAFNQQSD